MNSPNYHRLVALALCFGAALPAQAQDTVLNYVKTFPAMPRDVAGLVPFINGPDELTFASGTPYNDLVYTAFETGYMDGETDGFDVFYPIDPARATPGADAVRYVRTTGNVDLDVTYSGPAGDRILLGTAADTAPYFRRGANGVDDDWLTIQNFDYRHGRIELPGAPSDYELVYCSEADGCATTGYYLVYTAAAAFDLIAFVFACDDVGLPVSGNPPRNPRALCNADGALSLDNPTQFAFVQAGGGGSSPVLPQGLRQFGTAGKEIVGGIEADAEGNVYSYGSSDASLATGAWIDHGIWVSRTNADGSAGWTTELPIRDGSLLFDAAHDDTYLYLAGRTLGALPGFQNAGRWDAILLKLRLDDGSIVASDQWGNSNLDGYGSIVLDDAGALYVTGAGSPPGQSSTDPDHLLAKHRTSDLGNVWRVLDAPDAQQVFVSEAWGGASYHPGAAPGAGTLAVGGWYMSVGGSNAFASLWRDLDAAEPTRVAATTLASAGAEADWFLDSAFDSLGNVYYVGYTTGDLDGANAGEGDAFVVKYDAQLANPQVRRIGSGASDQFRRIETTATGELYAVGYTYGGLDPTLGYTPDGRSGDVLLARLDYDLTVQAVKQYGTPNGDERGYVTTAGGRVFVGGLTDGTLVGPSAGSYDVWLAEVDAETLEVGRTSSANDQAATTSLRAQLAVWPNPVVAGSPVNVSLRGAARGAVVRVGDARGGVQRTYELDGPTSIVLDGFAAGLYFLEAISPDGQRVARRLVVR